MNKDEIKKTVQSWLDKNQPEGMKIIISCGSAGALIATKQVNDHVGECDEWQTTWADNVIIYSDIINHHPIKIPRLITLPTPTSTSTLTCHCGRIFTKRFALTNHKKVCKQTEQEPPCETEEPKTDMPKNDTENMPETEIEDINPDQEEYL